MSDRTALYPRVLRLRHVHPNAWQRAALGEGAVAVAGVLVLADVATAWTLLVLPVAVAAVVKAHDVVAGVLARGGVQAGTAGELGRPGRDLVGEPQEATTSQGEEEQPGRWEHGAGEVGAGEVGAGEVGTGEVGTGEVGTGEVGTGEVGTGEVAVQVPAEPADSAGCLPDEPAFEGDHQADETGPIGDEEAQDDAAEASEEVAYVEPSVEDAAGYDQAENDEDAAGSSPDLGERADAAGQPSDGGAVATKRRLFRRSR